jgi:hypothetical protein
MATPLLSFRMEEVLLTAFVVIAYLGAGYQA